MKGASLRQGSGGGRPTKAEAAKRTEAILDKAREQFSLRGYAGTSIDEIAAALRCSKHTLYRRYASKLHLIEAVVERDVARFRAALLEAGAQESDPRASLRAMARVYFGFSASRDYSALYASVTLQAAYSAQLREKLQAWASVSLEPLRAAIGAAMPKPDCSTDNVRRTCDVLVDLLDGEANRAKWRNVDPNTLLIDDMFEERWNLFERWLLP